MYVPYVRVNLLSDPVVASQLHWVLVFPFRIVGGGVFAGDLLCVGFCLDEEERRG